MKNLILVLSFAALCVAVRAADPVVPAPVVVINSFNNVTVDGQSAGTVVDVLSQANPPANLRAIVLDAWIAYERTVVAAQTARADAGIAANAKDLADTKAALVKAQTDGTEKQTRLDAASTYIVALQKLLRDNGIAVPTP